MNRINPLHIIALLIVLTLFIYIELGKIKSELIEEKKSYITSESIAKELRSYKQFYGDKNHVQRALQKILSQHSLQKAKLKTSYTKQGVKIESNAIDLYSLNSFVSKIFNGAYKIQSLQIKAIDNKNAKLKMEIVW